VENPILFAFSRFSRLTTQSKTFAYTHHHTSGNTCTVRFPFLLVFVRLNDHTVCEHDSKCQYHKYSFPESSCFFLLFSLDYALCKYATSSSHINSRPALQHRQNDGFRTRSFCINHAELLAFSTKSFHHSSNESVNMTHQTFH